MYRVRKNMFEKKSEKIVIGIMAVMIAVSGIQLFRLSTTNQKTGKGNQKVREIYQEVVPEKGSPTGYGVKFSTEGMKQMSESYQKISLEGTEKQRYIDIGSSKGTSCEYCCGADFAVRKDGRSACGCKHNFAIAGMIKHLVKNTDMTDSEIKNEIDKWKAYYFPKQTMEQELKEREMQGQMTLPNMRGGC